MGVRTYLRTKRPNRELIDRLEVPSTGGCSGAIDVRVSTLSDGERAPSTCEVIGNLPELAVNCLRKNM